MANGQSTYRLGASGVGPDQGDGGTGVSQRLISVEPMVRYTFNLVIVSADVHPLRRASFSIWASHVRLAFCRPRTFTDLCGVPSKLADHRPDIYAISGGHAD
jgi:hypothetical protein